jgi:hypothetical protein
MFSGFRGVIPELPVVDVDASLDYYRDVLGFSVEGRHQDESGVVVFGSVLCGQANFYFSKTKEPIVANRCYVFADEVDALCGAFKAKGARWKNPMISRGVTVNLRWRTSTGTSSTTSVSATAWNE